MKIKHLFLASISCTIIMANSLYGSQKEQHTANTAHDQIMYLLGNVSQALEERKLLPPYRLANYQMGLGLAAIGFGLITSFLQYIDDDRIITYQDAVESSYANPSLMYYESQFEVCSPLLLSIMGCWISSDGQGKRARRQTLDKLLVHHAADISALINTHANSINHDSVRERIDQFKKLQYRDDSHVHDCLNTIESALRPSQALTLVIDSSSDQLNMKTP